VKLNKQKKRPKTKRERTPNRTTLHNNTQETEEEKERDPNLGSVQERPKEKLK
jgi:ribosome assembly protein YihI (activator of Der GTPase)